MLFRSIIVGKEDFVRLAGFKPSDVKNLIVPETGRTVDQELHAAANLMVRCIQDAIDDYYASYSPIVYQRTNQLKSAVLFSDIGSVTYNGSDAKITISINNFRWHPSWPFNCRGYGGSSVRVHMSDAFNLIDQGWTVIHGTHSHIYRFGNYEGFHFLEAAKNKFNSNNPLGIEVNY